MAHTPGPWSLRIGVSSTMERLVEVVGANGDVVCNNEDYYPQAVSEDDMQVISATTDLLEALQEYVRADEQDSELNPRKRKALAALAKATGKQS